VIVITTGSLGDKRVDLGLVQSGASRRQFAAGQYYERVAAFAD
jgi:hypothetical protein